ncbi:hypothetical protein SynWH8101_1297 [Synechococcus sp. WH 8101]|uniref:hypothetical protein n=1 Tax=Synechococcus sp. WH 8101 TaxID=59932 RepID=UPI001023BA2F|nr:hypothetical protein [Synechococcus sp. WH 8101]QBE68883.1 hypothetical protein SynWH8101_1297 [Synechococcus sp. WH 8101]QNI45110.1 hypothetical protein SynRCC2555_01327 [Synechococcus sp. WH 8101]
MLINFSNSQLAHVCQLADTNYPGALLLLDLYGALAYKAGARVQLSTSKRQLALDRCTNIKTIDRQLANLARLGWIELRTIEGKGTEILLKGIPPREDSPSVLTPQRDRAPTPLRERNPTRSGVDIDPSPGAHIKQKQQPNREEEKSSPSPVTTSSRGEEPSKPTAAASAADPPPDPPADPAPEPDTADLQQQLIDSWNRLKPDAWRPLKHLSPSRQRSIRALGGLRQVLALLPEVMAGAKANRWWSGKAIAFEQLIGTGLTPKGHFHALAEEAPEPSSKTNPTSTHASRLAAAINSIPAFAGPQHPDFFPPEPLTGDLRPRHGFPSKAERLAAREDARRFYAASGVQA